MVAKKVVDYLFGSLLVFSISLLVSVVYQPFIEEGGFSRHTIEQSSHENGKPFNLLHVANFVYAAEQGEIETVQRYLRMGMNPDAQDHNKDTALMGASLNGHKKIIKLLLKHNADPLLENEAGYTSIDYAKIYDDQKLTLFLAQATGHPETVRSLSSVEK